MLIVALKYFETYQCKANTILRTFLLISLQTTPDSLRSAPIGYSYPALLYVSLGYAFLASLQFGLQMGIINPFLSHILKDFHVEDSAWAASVLVVSLLFGCVLGSMFTGPLAGRIGTARICRLFIYSRSAEFPRCMICMYRGDLYLHSIRPEACDRLAVRAVNGWVRRHVPVPRVVARGGREISDGGRGGGRVHCRASVRCPSRLLQLTALQRCCAVSHTSFVFLCVSFL